MLYSVLFILGGLFIFFFSIHFIYLLLGIEFLLLSVFLLLCYDFFFIFGFAGLFYYLLVLVCMGGFSISLLVCLSRLSGRDFWCHSYLI